MIVCLLKEQALYLIKLSAFQVDMTFKQVRDRIFLVDFCCLDEYWDDLLASREQRLKGAN
jgi:hypothetical protein